MRLRALLQKLPKTIRLGTLQLTLLLLILAVVVAVMLSLSMEASLELEELRSSYFFQQKELLLLREEVEQWREFNRTVSALLFLSRGRWKQDDLLQTSRLLHGLSRSTGVDPLLVLAVVSVESRGNPWAVGRFRSGAESGAVGLMQIKFETAQIVARGMGQRVRSHELLRPDMNLLYGTAYLLQMVQRYGSLEKGLIAYNIGPGALQLALKQNRKLPKRYYNRVLSNYQGLVNRFGADPHFNAQVESVKPAI